MSSNGDEKVYRQLLAAMTRMKSDIDKREIKEEIIKSYKKSELKSILNVKTMDELHDIRRALGVKNVSGFKKNELLEVLYKYIKGNIEYIYRNLAQEDIEITRAILAAGGRMELRDMEDIRALNFWGIAGVIERDKKIFGIIPQELQTELHNALKNAILNEKAKKLQYYYNIIKGYLYYYGVMEAEQVFNTIAALTDALEINEIMNFVRFNSNLDRGITFYNDLYSCDEVVDIEYIYREQKKREVVYAEVSKEMALEVSSKNFNKWNEQHRELNKYFIKKLNISIMEAGSLTNEIIYKIKNDYPFTKMIQDLSLRLKLSNLKGVDEMAGFIQRVYNYTTLWILKGRTPNELSAVKHKKSESVHLPNQNIKVGRNDLCPCGSGKKYKNCCLRIDQEKELTSNIVENRETVTDKYFSVKDYIELSGYPVIKFDFFLLELLNITGSTLHKVIKIDGIRSKEILKLLYISSKSFYTGCITCENNCLKTPFKNISFKSLKDKGLEVAELPKGLQKEICINFFYVEFINNFIYDFEEALGKVTDLENADKTASILYWALMDYISDWCFGNCDNSCIAEHNRNAYCKFCSFGNGKLPCPKDGKISYDRIKACEDDMEH